MLHTTRWKEEKAPNIWIATKTLSGPAAMLIKLSHPSIQTTKQKNNSCHRRWSWLLSKPLWSNTSWWEIAVIETRQKKAVWSNKELATVLATVNQKQWLNLSKYFENSLFVRLDEQMWPLAIGDVYYFQTRMALTLTEERIFLLASIKWACQGVQPTIWLAVKMLFMSGTFHLSYKRS